jgi:hypothetical protein
MPNLRPSQAPTIAATARTRRPKGAILAIYTFYLCAGDGAASSFEAFELGGDEFAPERALKMLSEHPSCAYVAVWAEDREILLTTRGE